MVKLIKLYKPVLGNPNTFLQDADNIVSTY